MYNFFIFFLGYPNVDKKGVICVNKLIFFYW